MHLFNNFCVLRGFNNNWTWFLTVQQELCNNKAKKYQSHNAVLKSWEINLIRKHFLSKFFKTLCKLGLKNSIYNLVGQVSKSDIVCIYSFQNISKSSIYLRNVRKICRVWVLLRRVALEFWIIHDLKEKKTKTIYQDYKAKDFAYPTSPSREWLADFFIF